MNWDTTLQQYESRIQALEKQCLTEEEREINQLVFKMVRAIRSTVWLTNGVVKYLAGPAGIALGIWFYGVSAFDWFVEFVTGGTAK